MHLRIAETVDEGSSTVQESGQFIGICIMVMIVHVQNVEKQKTLDIKSSKTKV